MTDWPSALPLAYTGQLGLEEGLEAFGAGFVTIPFPWWPYAREICGGQRFDQVWVEVSHHGPVDPTFAEWLASLAPVVVGFVLESLDYTPAEVVLNPKLPGM